MKERGRRIVRKLRNTAVVGLGGCMLVCSVMQSDAATLKDVFDEHYYADTYVDLKEAFGYDREALWNHFITYGLNEGRNMNGLIDIVKYREEYADLQEAFGDNWDAYLDHFLVYGAKEGRDTGTNFSTLDYAGRYADLQEVFGDDVLALWNHYQLFGATEKREARSEVVVVAEKEAKRRQEESKGSQGYTERWEYGDWGWEEFEYDSAGRKVRWTAYHTEDGSGFSWNFDSDGNAIKNIWFENNRITGWSEMTYDSAGKIIKSIGYYVDGRRIGSDINGDDIKGYKSISEWDSAGNRVSTWYDQGGNKIMTERCDADGNEIGTTWYDADGNEITEE